MSLSQVFLNNIVLNSTIVNNDLLHLPKVIWGKLCDLVSLSTSMINTLTKKLKAEGAYFSAQSGYSKIMVGESGSKSLMQLVTLLHSQNNNRAVNAHKQVLCSVHCLYSHSPKPPKEGMVSLMFI